jgi:hypothetical protein
MNKHIKGKSDFNHMTGDIDEYVKFIQNLIFAYKYVNQDYVETLEKIWKDLVCFRADLKVEKEQIIKERSEYKPTPPLIAPEPEISHKPVLKVRKVLFKKS